MIRLFLSAICLMLAVLLGAAYYDRYFKWRGCFNELGRCFDPDTATVMLEQSGLVWGTGSVIFLFAAIYQYWQFARTRRRKK